MREDQGGSSTTNINEEKTMNHRIQTTRRLVLLTLVSITLLGILVYAQATGTFLKDTTAAKVENNVLVVTDIYPDYLASGVGQTTITARYTLTGRPLSSETKDQQGTIVSKTFYVYENNDINNPSTKLIRVTSSDGVIKENLQFNSDGLPTLARLTIESSATYIGYDYQPTSDGLTQALVYIGADQQEVEQLIGTKDYITTYLLDEQQDLLDIVPHYTKQIQRSYARLSTGDLQLIEWKSVLFSSFTEKHSFTYDASGAVQSIKIVIDAEGDGVADEKVEYHYTRENGIVTKVKEIDENGAHTLNLIYDVIPPREWSTLIGATDQNNKPVAMQYHFFSPIDGLFELY